MLVVIYISINIFHSNDSLNDKIFSHSLLIQTNKTWSVEIWSKSAIGQYLWENVLNGKTESKLFPNNLYLEGWKTIGPVNFRFRTGPSLKPQSLQTFDVDNLILILNWRSVEKIDYAKKWLDVLQTKTNSSRNIKNVGIIALGNERCNNTWFIQKYLDSMLKKNLRFLFVTYDWKRVDNQVIFQWPLGVATYRNFPSILNDHTLINLQMSRPYLCNFIATVYTNSTRQELEKLFEQEIFLKSKCFIKTRTKWEPDEDEQSLSTYVEGLKLSDLTLSPIGMNHECYRILEAVEYGSIPVIEENREFLTRTQCDKNNVLRLFQEFKAPFIYVSNWTKQLPNILKEYQMKSLTEKIKERIHLMKWYHKFKIRLKNKLVNIIQKQFK